eukprot:10777784-Lingulodinium_polyedra.AAC.1
MTRTTRMRTTGVAWHGPTRAGRGGGAQAAPSARRVCDCARAMCMLSSADLHVSSSAQERIARLSDASMLAKLRVTEL